MILKVDSPIKRAKSRKQSREPLLKAIAAGAGRGFTAAAKGELRRRSPGVVAAIFRMIFSR